MLKNMNPPRQNDQEYTPFEGTPFGYLFTSAGDEPGPAPEAPARGEPLLNDYELDSSHQFFDGFQNDDTKILDSLGGFQHEPVPNFHAVATSLGPPITSNMGGSLNFGHIEHELNMRMDQANLASPTDHLPPHNILSYNPPSYETYPASRPIHTSHFPEAFGNPVSPSRRRPPVSSDPPLEQLQFGNDPVFPTTSAVRPSVPHPPTPSTESASGKNPLAHILGFGSDQNFQNRSYVAPESNLEGIQTAEKTIEAHMQLLEENTPNSTNTTAPPSPTLYKSKRRLSEEDRTNTLPSSVAGKGRANSASFPLGVDKRQRKTMLEEVDEENEVSKPQQLAKKQRPVSKLRTVSAGGAGSISRRKSQAGESKPPRQNLTEEEKKRNHIRSEQKRRNQIKDGFANLITLMPNTVAAGTSKCAILSQAVEWLRGLIEGNEKLRAQLQQMGD